MLKMIDVLRNVDRSKENSHYTDSVSLKHALSLDGWHLPEDYEQRVKSYYLIQWLCTDTHVGLAALYFDNELIGYSWQPSRKSDIEYTFISKETALKLREYLDLKEELSFNLMKPDEEIDDTYVVQYGSELLTFTGFYNGQPVTVIKESIVRGYEEPVELWSMVQVLDAAGKKHSIHLSEFQMPLKLKRD